MLFRSISKLLRYCIHYKNVVKATPVYIHHVLCVCKVKKVKESCLFVCIRGDFPSQDGLRLPSPQGSREHFKEARSIPLPVSHSEFCDRNLTRF